MNKKEKVSGIYIIYNIPDEKFYIGSSVNIYKRWKSHKKRLEYNQHNNKYLTEVYKKYGIDSFIFKIIEYCLPEKTIDREQYYLDLYKPYERNIGYNIMSRADRVFLTDEIKNRISKSLTGKSITNKAKERISISNSGENNGNFRKNYSEEEKNILSKSLIRYYSDEENRKKHSKIMLEFYKNSPKYQQRKHGTSHTYGVHKCRCDLCLDYKKEENKKYRLKKKTSIPCPIV